MAEDRAEPTTAGAFDPETLKGEDFRTADPQPEPEPEPMQPDPQEPEEPAIEEETPHADGDGDESEEGEPGQDDESQDGIRPDDIVLEALKDSPDALKRLEQQFDGLNKKERQIAEREERVGYEEEGYKTFKSYNEAFANPQTVLPALEDLASYLSKAHGKDIRVSVGETAEGEEFEFESDRRLFDKAVQTAVDQAEARLLQRLGVDPSALQSLVKREETAQEEAKFAALIDRLEKPTVAKIEKQTGWKVDRKMLEKAGRKYPALIQKDSLTALKQTFPDSWADHRAGISVAESKKGPGMLPSGAARGFEMPDPEDITIAGLMRINNMQA